MTFTQRTADRAATAGAAYVGFCGYCDALNTRPFDNGIATNVGGKWHKATAAGLPRRYITSVQVDPVDPKTVYVTLGGYSRRWLPVGAVGESTRDVGEGHVFKSTDAGEHFTDISGNLPDAPAEFTLVRNGQLVVATDVGVFLAAGTDGGTYQQLGQGLPAAPVYSLELKPKASPTEPDTLIVATQGRGVWRYVVADPAKAKPTGARAPAAGSGTKAATTKSTTSARRGVITRFTVRRAGARRLLAIVRVRRTTMARLAVTRRGRTVRTVTRRLRAGRTYRLPLGVPGRGAYQVALWAGSERRAVRARL